jgi:hypothetical protein
MTKKDILNFTISLAERNEWTFLDEKLFLLEELSDDQILDEVIQKLYVLKNVPADIKELCIFAGNYVKNNHSKMKREDRYLLSVFLAYGSEKDLQRKV